MDNPVESIRTPDGAHVLSSFKERGAKIVSPSVAARLQQSQLQKYIGLVIGPLSRRTVDGYTFDMFAVSVPEFAPSFNLADPLVGGCSMDVLCSLDGNAKTAVKTGNLVLLIGRLTARRVGGKPSFLFHATSIVAILETSLTSTSASPRDEEIDEVERDLSDDVDDARMDADEIRSRSRDADNAIAYANDPGYGIDGSDDEEREPGGFGDEDENENDGGSPAADMEELVKEDNEPRRERTGRRESVSPGRDGEPHLRPCGASRLVALRPSTGIRERLKRETIRTGVAGPVNR